MWFSGQICAKENNWNFFEHIWKCLFLFHSVGLAMIGCSPRTKQWMSDGTWQPRILLFLPASVAQRAQGDAPQARFQVWSRLQHLVLPFNSTHNHFNHYVLPAAFVEKPVNSQSDENKSLRRYASLMRSILRVKFDFKQHTYRIIQTPLRPWGGSLGLETLRSWSLWHARSGSTVGGFVLWFPRPWLSGHKLVRLATYIELNTIQLFEYLLQSQSHL